MVHKTGRFVWVSAAALIHGGLCLPASAGDSDKPGPPLVGSRVLASITAASSGHTSLAAVQRQSTAPGEAAEKPAPAVRPKRIRGLIVGLAGLGLAGAGGYLVSTSKTVPPIRYESRCSFPSPPRPGAPSLPPICVQLPIEQPVRYDNGKLYGGIGLASAGVSLAVVGFARMR